MNKTAINFNQIYQLHFAGKFKQILRFAITGVLTAIIYFFMAFAFIELINLRPGLASMLAFILVLPINYGLHKLWSFESRRLHRETVPRFVMVITGGLIINSIIIELILGISNIHYFFAQVVAALSVISWNLVLFKFWVFRH